MTTPLSISPDEPKLLSPEDRIAITEQAVQAAVTVAQKHGLRVGEPAVLADAYSVRVHLQPSPVVARVSLFTPLLRFPIEDWLTRELSVTGYLAASGIPVVAPSEDLPPGPHHQDGFVMTFWRYVHATSPQYVPDVDTSVAMLADLHLALRKYSGDLPILAPPLNDIPRGIERIKRGGLLPANDIAMLERKFAALRPKLEAPAGKLQPLHGDAHAFNLIPSQKGLLWNDFEDVCLGPLEWDLASMNDTENKILAAYPGEFSPEALEPYRLARQLHVVAWVYAMKPEFPDWEDPAKAVLETLRSQP